MRCRWISIGLALVALALGPAACGGGDEESTSPTPSVETPSHGSGPPGDLGDLPPGFVECMAREGYEVKSPDDIHSAPPAVLQACFGAAQQGD
jgi:hypothetical protein